MEESEEQVDGQLSPIAVIKSIFEDFNLTELSSDVYARVLDIISKYTGEILLDAKAYAAYGGRATLVAADVQLAIESISENVSSSHHRSYLLEYAEKINSQSLPPIKPGQGIKLAPEKFTLTAPNFGINIKNETAAEASFAPPPSGTMVPPRLRLQNPNSNPVTVYRVSNAPGGPGQRPSLFPTSAATAGNESSGIRVIAPGASPASLIRVQPPTFSPAGHPLARPQPQ